MAGKRTLNARNLEALGAAVLADLLIEVSGGHAVIQRRLRLALAAAEGVDGAAQAVRQRLSAIDRARTFVNSRRRQALLSDLEAQLQAITGPIAAADPRQACDLLLRFLELSDGVLGRCSDSTGAVMGLFERAAEQLAPLAQAARLEPETLAELAADLLSGNSHAPFTALVPNLKDVLGDGGLQRLDHHCRQRGARHGDTVLRQIAVARGDWESYLAQFAAEDLRRRDIAATVAAQLLRSGRAGQALEILDRATDGTSGPSDSRWHDGRIAVLEALGRPAEAQAMRWQWFTQTLSIPHLRDHLRLLDDFSDGDVEERALQVAERYPDSLQGLRFLVEWPALARAAPHGLAHAEEWAGQVDGIHTAATERLSAAYPLAALLLLRPVVIFALGRGGARRCRHAAEQLRQCERLAARIDDWQGHPDHAAYLDQLAERFGSRWEFWKLLER